jgi:predicted short-subunit dehydrogenase-like oxidoreductase (DUF2520 family)
MSQTESITTKPTVSVVGSGRLGMALAIALESSAYSILALVARHPARARKASALLGRPPLALGARQIDKLPPSDFILITTPDDVIADAARQLAASQKGVARGCAVLHTSGALSCDILLPLAETGFHVGSMHPLVSVSDPRTGAEALRSAFYCVEGDSVALRVARSIVRDLNGQSFSIKSSNKTLYHAAAVIASGHLVALFDLAVEILVNCGLSQRSARQVLMPLVESTVKNLKISDPAHALTGTFARGDVATVRSHLHVLTGANLKEALEAYRLLGRHSIELAEKKGVERTILKRMKKALAAAVSKKE